MRTFIIPKSFSNKSFHHFVLISKSICFFFRNCLIVLGFQICVSSTGWRLLILEDMDNVGKYRIQSYLTKWLAAGRLIVSHSSKKKLCTCSFQAANIIKKENRKFKIYSLVTYLQILLTSLSSYSLFKSMDDDKDFQRFFQKYGGHVSQIAKSSLIQYK